MTDSAERVYALLVEANPIPDLDNLPPHLFAVDSRRDDMQTQTPRRTEPQLRPQKRKWAPALAVLVAIAVVAVGFAIYALTIDGDEGAPPVTQPAGIEGIDAINAFAAAIASDDLANLPGFADGSELDRGLVEWHAVLQADPVLSECQQNPFSEGLVTVRCTVTYGDDYFHNIVTGETMTSYISGRVDAEGIFSGAQWPPPDGLVGAEADFRAWVQQAHPELEDRMWGGLGYLGITMNRDSGELRMQLLDEYLAAQG
jgi:hypothetical protein